jgi:bifunctional DNA-binding transcriptional regulator/antitoxin component of YhaV-PrlF toxin-antitoxin module
MFTIPADIRRRLDIEAGDKLRWHTEDHGPLSAEIVHENYGAFDDAETANLGGDGLATHDLTGYDTPTG